MTDYYSKFSNHKGNDQPTARIVSIQAIPLSAAKVKAIAAKVTVDKIRGGDKDGTVRSNYMGASKDSMCKNPQCLQTIQNCTGHIGYISTEKQYVHSSFGAAAVAILNLHCDKCYQFLPTHNECEKAKLNSLALTQLGALYVKQKKCRICGQSFAYRYCLYKMKEGGVAPSKGSSYDGRSVVCRRAISQKTAEIVPIPSIIEVFKRVTPESLALIDVHINPMDYITDIISVIPNRMRVPITSQWGQEKEDRYTDRYAHLLKQSQAITKAITEGNDDDTQLLNLLSANADLMFGKTGPGATSNRHGNVSIKNNFDGKDGVVRRLFFAKCADKSARTVLEASPIIHAGDAEIPFVITEKIHKTELVTDLSYRYWRYLNSFECSITCIVKSKLGDILISPKLSLAERMTIATELKIGDKIIQKSTIQNCILPEMVSGKNIWRFRYLLDPSLLLEYIERRDGQRIYISNISSIEKRVKILAEIEIGSRLSRKLRDGDVVILNRNPTLDKRNMMVHNIKIVTDTEVTRIASNILPPYGGDCDGDEINSAFPQDAAESIECKLFASVEKLQINETGRVTIMPIADGIIAMNDMSKREKIDKAHWMNIVMSMGKLQKIYVESHTIRCKLNDIDPFSGKALFSMLLPPDFTFTFDKDTIFRDGIMISGVVVKQTISAIIVQIISRYKNGDKRALNFTSYIQSSARCYLSIYPYGFSLRDLYMSKQVRINNKAIIKEGTTTINNILKGINKVKRNERVALEQQVYRQIKNIEDKLENNIRAFNKELPNKYTQMIESGAKGSSAQLRAATTMVGFQQSDNNLVSFKLSDHKRLSVYNKLGEVTAESIGFIGNSFIEGITTAQRFVHQKFTRIGIIDSSVVTPASGYISRRISQIIGGTKIMPDSTVRSSTGRIIESCYSGDGFSNDKVVRTPEGFSFISIPNAIEYITARDRYDKLVHEGILPPLSADADDNPERSAYLDNITRLESREIEIESMIANNPSIDFSDMMAALDE